MTTMPIPELDSPRVRASNERGSAGKIRALRRIFAAVDDSPRAPGVVATALALAREAQAALCFYQAVAVPPEFPPAAATRATDGLPAYLHRQSIARLEAFARRAPDLSCDVEVEESLHPGESILRGAARYGADLIVLGAHTRGIVARVFGTTMGHVIRAAPCNVLVARAAPEAPPSSARSHEPPFVLACVDASLAKSTVLGTAAQIARIRGLDLRALRVVTGAGELPPSNDALIAEGVADLERAANQAGIALAGASAVIDEVAWRAICALANGRAALVVVGARASGPLRSLATTAAHVVQHGDMPVLIVRLQA